MRESGSLRARSAPSRRGRITRVALTLGLALTGTTVAVATSATGAVGAVTLPTWPTNPNWQSYVQGNGAANLTPVSATSTGNVTNPQALAAGGSGVATLTYTSGQTTPPTIVLDFGKEVGGLPYFGVSSVAPTSPATSVGLKAGYSEARQYLLGANSSVVGDANGNNGVGTDGHRTDTFTLTSSSGGTTVRNAVTAVQGGERYAAITLTTPGTVRLSSAGVTAEFNNLGAGSYTGYFISSDDTLNRIWYDGVYTAQTDDVPIGGVCSSATSCSRAPAILDGAKRDRRPWSGDLSVEGRTLFDSLGFNAGGSDYIKYTIGGFGSAPSANGEICGQVSNWVSYPTSKVSCSVYSPSYSMYYPINLAEYYLYSGDIAFAEAQYKTMKNELAYENTTISSTTGLSSASGSDWDFYDGSKGGSTAQGGAVAATNMLAYEAHANGAWLAGQLAAHDPSNASAATWASDAATWSSQSTVLKNAINARLFNTGKGAYQLSSSNNGSHPATAVPQDANAQAILFGVAPTSNNAGILSYLKNHLWGAYGPEPYSSDAGYSTIISPFVSGYELDARFASGDTTNAVALTKALWGPMVNSSGPFYTGTLWEKLGQNGQITDSNASLAHGWSTAPVSAFDSYLLGASPVGPGYSTWQVKPQPGSLTWVEGQVPTAHSTLTVAWAQSTQAGTFHIRVVSPSGTSGQVWIPLASSTSVSSALTTGTTYVGRNGNYDVYQVGAGAFEFSSTPGA